MTHLIPLWLLLCLLGYLITCALLWHTLVSPIAQHAPNAF